MAVSIKSPKKLIEVALPLDVINIAAAKEKSIRQGHPSTLHLWWARRPLAAARAVIFAQMVNDPGYERNIGRGVNKQKAAAERERLFKIIEQLVQWENITNEKMLSEARVEIWKSWRETCELNKNHPQAAELFDPGKLPAFHDPFAGGGTLPLEAQRLGLDSYASDLNPVAVTINKAMIEIPPRFAGRAPVGPLPAGDKQRRLHDDWSGARGLAEDVRRYGAWMRNEAEKRIGHLYPTIKITSAMARDRADLKPLIGEKLTVIACLWARTVASPNPAFSNVHVPLVRSFWLSTKPGQEVWVEPVVSVREAHYEFRVRTSGKPLLEGTVQRSGGICLMSGSPMPFSHIRTEARAGRMSQRLMAIVASSSKGRVFLPPLPEIEEPGLKADPPWKPNVELPTKHRNFQPPGYGMMTVGDLFTVRQLVALNQFSDLVAEAFTKCQVDAAVAGYVTDDVGLDAGGTGARAYAEAIALLLGLAVSRSTNTLNALAVWSTSREQTVNLFSRQAIPMAWDFPEVNPFAGAAGDFGLTTESMAKSLLAMPAAGNGHCQQIAVQDVRLENRVISTDPPYYDNIAYADLSDFFYVWLRRSLRPIFPSLFSTLATPKQEELIASPNRHGSKEASEAFFLEGMTSAMHNLASQAHPAFPVTIYYAFKQAETEGAGTASTGWETFLEAVLKAGFAVTATWPMRTERPSGVKSEMNVLASSIILACRQRPSDAPTVSRRDFLRELNASLPLALDEMTRGGINSPVAPVDLSQAIIGPGMAIFSQFAAVLEANGSPMTVRTALTLINRFLAEDDFDHETQFCLHWFDGYGWGAGKYGDADVLARAKGTSVAGIADAGVVESGGGNVRLFRYAEYPDDWSPSKDNRTPVWEALHHMIRALQDGGEGAAGKLLAGMPARAESIRALAYRLYTLCERKGWAEEARAYNELITSWTGIESASQETGVLGSQATLDI